MPAVSPLTMLTFGPMIDSETARRLLRHYGIPFVEDRHLFGWASVLALFKAGTPQIPVIYGPGLTLVGSRSIWNRFDASMPEDRKLVPSDPALGAQAVADWEAFNGKLAADVAAVAYYHLLPQVRPMVAAFSLGVNAKEAGCTASCYGALRGLFTLLLQLNPAHTAQALARIRTAMAAVDARVADGRAFLVGDRLTLSDVSLAATMAPLVVPSACTAPVPAFGDMPPELQAIASELRARPCGRFIDRAYAAMA